MDVKKEENILHARFLKDRFGGFGNIPFIKRDNSIKLEEITKKSWHSKLKQLSFIFRLLKKDGLTLVKIEAWEY